MKCIKDNIVNSFEINKSIFITDIVRVNSLDEVNSLINEIKLKYKDATHYCYAYIIDNLRKSSDDGEPGGTAGVPIMEVLLKNELNYILCVVTRYFGGIKLGASGLVRAYRNSIVEALKLCKFYELVDGYTLEINTTYDNQKKIDFLIKDLEYKKDYFTNIKYTIKCPKDKIKILDDNNIKYNILEKNKIEI